MPRVPEVGLWHPSTVHGSAQFRQLLGVSRN